jgi:hypothetical protein
VVDEEALIPVYLPVLRSSPVSNIPPVLHAHSLTYRQRYIILAIDTILSDTHTHTQNILSKCWVTI